MYEYVLPPIGTTRYPFTGNFDGNGHTISNLRIKNDNSALTDSPETFLDYMEIIGFFGVVGSLNGTTVNGSQLAGDNFEQILGTTYTYNSGANEIKNFNLLSPTITTSTSQSLMGIVAGYVNGTVENVKVGGTSSINKNGIVENLSYSDNLSEYTIMGYVTAPYIDFSDVAVIDIATPTFESSQFIYADQGASAGWGGSIDMADLYNRLINVRSSGLDTISSSNHIATEIWRYDQSGELIGNGPLTLTGLPVEFRMKTLVDVDDDGKYSGSGQYVFSYKNAVTQFNYLASTYKNIITTHETGTEGAFYIRSGNTYLNINDNLDGVSDAITITGTNTKWVSDGNYIRTTGYDGNTYFLNNNGSSLTIGSTGTTSWNTAEENAISCSAGYIQYENGWILKQNYKTYYTIASDASGNNYLNVTSAPGITNGNGTATADLQYLGNTLWDFSNTASLSGYLSTTINGSTYYLYGSRTGGNYSLSINPTDRTSWTNSGNKLTGSSFGLQYYNGWRANSTTNATTLTITPINASVPIASLSFGDPNGEPVTSAIVTRTSKLEPSEYSYIPLSALATSPFTVDKRKNTGYIIAGSHETDSDRKSDIRVSQYGKTNIRSGLTNTTNPGLNDQISDSRVKTVKNGTIQNINVNDYKRYTDAVNQFNTTLSNTTNVYGLHFMDAAISKNNLITAPMVSIEGQKYENYEMPEDCIDFIVHQKGYITFFAGTYFTGNNSFCSLHVIERYNDKKIKDIKEIKRIFGTGSQNDDYIYLYSDNSYSDGESRAVNINSFTKEDGKEYNMIFDTYWITNPGTSGDLGTTNVFYFEIPVNDGEYALGSVDGRIGAYLMYLDIAANAQLVNRAKVTEKFDEVTYTHRYPTGATFTNGFAAELTSPIDPAFAGLMKTSKDTVSVTVDPNNDNILTVTGIDGGYDMHYIKDGKAVTLVGSPNQTIYAGGKPSGTVSVKIQRTTYYDYNAATDRYTITEVEARKPYYNGIPENTSYSINAWQATYVNGTWARGSPIASNVSIASMEHHPADGNIPEHYLYKVGTGENDETLRFEASVFNEIAWTSISPYRNRLWYAIKNNSATTIIYNYTITITANTEATGTNDLYTFSDSTDQYTVNIYASGAGNVTVAGARIGLGP
jgi:hypothetical protein